MCWLSTARAADRDRLLRHLVRALPLHRAGLQGHGRTLRRRRLLQDRCRRTFGTVATTLACLAFFFSSSFVLLDLGAKSTDSAELEGGKNLSYIGYYVTIYSTN